MKPAWGVLFATLAARHVSAHPLVIDKATFQLNGGDLNDIPNSIKTQNELLRSYSYNTPWLAVGQISGCTATWLGDKDNWTYILTAAHCAGYKDEVTSVTKTFKAWDGRVIASGKGTAYVPPQRIHKPSGMGGASTDLAILKLPTKAQIVGKTGRPLERPILNDALDEKGRDVVFVGYGAWGVGGLGSGSFRPAKGARRLYARARIDDIFELDHGIGATYDKAGPSASWGRVGPGDSGSAWWQVRDGRAVIIAATNGGTGSKSTGVRVAKYKSWILSKYPEARFSSETGPRACIVSTQTNDRYCMSPGDKAEYALPEWIRGHTVRVDAGPGTAVELCDMDNLSYNRVAKFVGSVDNSTLKAVKANNGETLDFSRPHSMRVLSSTTNLGCITALATVDRFCLPAGQKALVLPAWIIQTEVQVEAVAGAAVTLCDFENLSYNRLARFTGFMQNWDLKSVTAANRAVLDFSRPRSMKVS
ncbi:hypothetical protein MY5147_009702 [Beauveria neobassiana]